MANIPHADAAGGMGSTVMLCGCIWGTRGDGGTYPCCSTRCGLCACVGVWVCAFVLVLYVEQQGGWVGVHACIVGT